MSYGVKSSSSSKVRAKTLPAFEFPVRPMEWTKFARAPIQVFYLFFTMVVMEGIVLHTNTMAMKN